jgi:hypothetical protein
MHRKSILEPKIGTNFSAPQRMWAKVTDISGKFKYVKLLFDYSYGLFIPRE